MSKVIIDGVKVTINGVEVEYVPKGEEVKEWPRQGDDYYFVSSQNEVSINGWANDDLDKKRLASGNCFPTEQKAEYERLRRECMATRWVPRDGESFYSAMQMEKKWKIHSCLSKELVLLGLAAPTEPEAKARWDMYGDAWMDALESKK